MTPEIRTVLKVFIILYLFTVSIVFPIISCGLNVHGLVGDILVCVHDRNHTTLPFSSILQYVVDCKKKSKLPKVGFQLGKQTFELTGDQYVDEVGQL